MESWPSDGAGLFAKLAYFDELDGELETEWMVRERAEATAREVDRLLGERK
jgi:hypothetical protein